MSMALKSTIQNDQISKSYIWSFCYRIHNKIIKKSTTQRKVSERCILYYQKSWSSFNSMTKSYK